MKQGNASSSKVGSTKVEPTSKAVSPAATANIGIQQRYAKMPPNLYEGRGLQAPMVSCKSHKCGSQGRH